MSWSLLNPWRELRGLPRDSWFLAVATFVNRAGTMVLPFLVLHLTRNLGFSPSQAGGCLALYGVAALITAPISGRLGDLFGLVRLLTLSLFGAAVVMVLLPLARTPPQVIVTVVLLGLVSEAGRAPTYALVGELAGPELRRQGFALNRMAVNLGMSAGPALGGFLAGLSFRALFWVDAGTSFAAGLMLVLRPPHPGSTPVHPSQRATGPSALSDRRLRYVFIALIPVVLVFFQLQAAMPLYLVRDLGLSITLYGLLFTLNTGLILATEVRLNALTAHWPAARSMAVSALLIGCGFGAMAIARSALSVALTVVVWTVGEMLLFPASSAYFSEIAPPDRRGEYMGYYAMAFGIGFSLGPWAGAAVLEAASGRVLWIGCFCAAAVSAALLARVDQPARASSPMDALDKGVVPRNSSL